MRPSPAERNLMRHFLRLFGLSLVVGACATFAATAKASGILGLGSVNCGSTSPVFAPWGDYGQYFLASDGGFEGGGAGWGFAGGARVVAGNEPFHLHSSQDDSSLLLPYGAVAASPQI